MEMVMFCHPKFLPSQSMPRFAEMLKSAYLSRGHKVTVWSPRPVLFKFFPRGRLSKWAGYADQYVLFPLWVRRALKRTVPGTLFVFCDQALGPWVPAVRNRPHVVHVHDLLALRSALGDVSENPTSVTGQIYQRYIRSGFRYARHFISISEKTRADLHRFGQVQPKTSEVVYNGLNYPYHRLSAVQAGEVLLEAGITPPPGGMILHIGGGQWYKNLRGVISIYAHYAARIAEPLPLWCVSPAPNPEVRRLLNTVPPGGMVRFFSPLESATLQALYSQAAAFVFPSLAEGFGWPLIEAQACGCPVITTDEAPMNEVAGPAARYLPRLKGDADLESWSIRGADVLVELLAEDPAQRLRRREGARSWAQRFDPSAAIDAYLRIYQGILDDAATPGTSPADVHPSTRA